MCIRLFLLLGLVNVNKIITAQDAGRFKEELVPVPVKVRKELVDVTVDEHPKPQTTLEGLKKLPTIFKKDGLVTAGSASVCH